MLLNAQNEGNIRGIRVRHNSLHINNLFFVDDALLFITNKNADVMTVWDILYKFKAMFGQKVNLSCMCGTIGLKKV